MKALRKLNVIFNINSFNICVAMAFCATEYNKDQWGANEVITASIFLKTEGEFFIQIF